MSFWAEKYHMQNMNCHLGQELCWKYGVWGEERNNTTVVQPEWLLVKLAWCGLVSSDGVSCWDCISRAWLILAHEIKLSDRNICAQWLNSMCMARVRCVHVHIQKMCSENCADICEQMELKHWGEIKFNFSKPYNWHNPHMLICKKIEIDVFYIACLLLALSVEENEKLQEKWEQDMLKELPYTSNLSY